ncbi:TetR/AcrR family transcriptional regulator [Peterkaempfera sp. SMS 1(5)a]|uniref:TetR/AcrR family transcriptional regulator n=1 Tax=Peterkaempfera podocarpi TaxID=3232308 RepID=UPI00367267C0
MERKLFARWRRPAGRRSPVAVNNEAVWWDAPAQLAARPDYLCHGFAIHDGPMPSDHSRPVAATPGYAKGRARREEIIAAAATVYADAGYDGASLREIAKRVGISHAGLGYYFPNREALLAAVLERRDEEDTARGGPPGTPGLDGVRRMLDLAAHNERHPGMVELYVRLAAEAVEQEHPAHAYFTRHYRDARDYMRSCFAALAVAGQLREGVDPTAAAASFVALMDGLQVQWLANPDQVDMVGALRFFLQQVLSVPLG